VTHLLPDFIRHYGYAAVFLLMWVETFLPIFPSEMVMPLGGLIASQGKLSLVGVAIAGALGSITGAVTWYWIARALGYGRFRNLITRYGRITTVTPHEVDRLQHWFERLGTIMVLIGRIIPGVRTAVSIPAGLVRMPFPRFFLLSAIGALFSAAVLAGAGWLLRDHYDRVEHYLGPVTTGIVAAAVLLWLVRLALQFRKVRADH
jgi:membrane protein DedA with SNARE-associated domain